MVRQLSWQVGVWRFKNAFLMGAGLLLVLLPVFGVAQERDVREFVRSQYVEGMPYEAATAFGSDVVPELLDMLQDKEEAPYWTTIVTTLSIVGDDSAVKPLIHFIEEPVEDELSDSLYRAKASAVMALGYVVNKSGNQEAMDYLIASTDPDSWAARGISWRARFQPNAEARNVDLSTMAILGLALSGHPDAGPALESVPTYKFGEHGGVEGLIGEAMETFDVVVKDGLSAYYRRSMAGF